MKVGIIGMSTVGLSAGATLTRAGYETVLFCPDEEESEAFLEGSLPIYEEGLAHALREAKDSGNLKFVIRMQPALEGKILLFAHSLIPDADLEVTLRFLLRDLESAVRKAQTELNAVFLMPLPPGAFKLIEERVDEWVREINEERKDKREEDPESSQEDLSAVLSVCPCPAMPGEIYAWFCRPNPALIGTEQKASASLLREMLIRLGAQKKRILLTDPESVENAVWLREEYRLTQKLFANEAQAMGIRPLFRKITREMALPKPGFIPNPELLLLYPDDVGAQLLKEVESKVVFQNTELVEEAYNRLFNTLRKRTFPGETTGVLLLGLAQYPGSGDMRGAPQIELVKKLLGLPVKLYLYLPEGSQDLKWRLREYHEQIEFLKSLDNLGDTIEIILNVSSELNAKDIEKSIHAENDPAIVSIF